MNAKRIFVHVDPIRRISLRTGIGLSVWTIGILLMTCQSPERRTAERRSGDHKPNTAESTKLITPAFYHWKAIYNPTRSELLEIKRLKVNRLYIHFFDVDWDTRTWQPVPKAFVRFRQKPAASVVPVVFITNRTLLQLTPGGLPELATHITDAIRRISRQSQLPFREVQFDCDWSGRTRDRYFQLLTLLEKNLRCPLSATIRLHQIKYADQTGIPPVARGMLMLYNVADWKQVDTQNSIYDPAVVDSYLPFLATYRLPLDAVLPLFRWTVVYRNNRFLTLLNNLDRKTLATTPFLTVQPDTNRFRARCDTIAWGFSIRRGDLFRAESVPAETLLTEKKRLLHQLPDRPFTFALYHLDSTIVAAYSRETIQSLLQPLP